MCDVAQTVYHLWLTFTVVFVEDYVKMYVEEVNSDTITCWYVEWLLWWCGRRVQCSRQFILLVHHVHQQACSVICHRPVADKHSTCHRCFSQVSANSCFWRVMVADNSFTHSSHMHDTWCHIRVTPGAIGYWFLVVLQNLSNCCTVIYSNSNHY